MCRSVEDCAIVLNAIHGSDDLDLTVIDLPFNWNAKTDARKLRMGYLKAAFDEEHSLPEEKVNDFATLEVLRKLRIDLKAVKLPDYPITAASMVAWFGEIGSVWDDLVRSGRDALLEGKDTDGVGNLSRMTRMVPAVESFRASRVRTLIMQAAAKIFDDVDVYVAPYSSADYPAPVSRLNLQMTTVTGHPAVIVQNGFTRKGTPTGITFVGKLFGEAELLAVAKAYQDATGFHLKHPKHFE